MQPSTFKSIQRSPQAGLLSDYTGPPSKLLAERLILSDISADSGGTADSDLALTNPETRRISAYFLPIWTGAGGMCWGHARVISKALS